MVGPGKATRVLAFAMAVAFVAGALDNAWTPATAASHSNVDPSLRAGEVALVHTTSGRAGALSVRLSDLGAQDVQTYGAADTVVARLSEPALAAVKTDTSVTVATADFEVSALDRHGFENWAQWPEFTKLASRIGDKRAQLAAAEFDTQTAFASIGAPLAWRRSTGEGARVALMDTGVAKVADLKGNVTARLDFIRDGQGDDPAGHGTFIAGLIAANGVMKGVAPDAKIVSLRMLDANGNGNGAAVVAAFDWLLKHHNEVDVLNVSWGAKQSNTYRKDTLSALVEAAWFTGITVVAAAGNGGPNAGTITTPGSDPFVVTVGSYGDKGTLALGDDAVSSFSAKGPTFDGFAKPDTLAPGEHITSLRVPGLAYIDANGNPVGSMTDRYIHMTGTSASTGFVTGVAALVASAHRSYTPNQTKGAIVASGRPIDGTTVRGVNALAALFVTPPANTNADLQPSSLLLGVLASAHQLKPNTKGVTWEGVTWESISWESISWESISWEGVTWEGVTWEELAQ